jgi:preprotein translocase subunit SecG
MRLIIVFIHLAVCIALIMIVLLQKGKGASMGAAFGGSSQTVFGSAGASSFLQKVTVAAAVIFMLTSLTLALLFGRGASTSVMRGRIAAHGGAFDPADGRLVACGAAGRIACSGRCCKGLDRAEVVEIGRHAILRGWWAKPVRVQVPPSAPPIELQAQLV